MAAKSLKIGSLDLDIENPRIKLATGQRNAIQKILNDRLQGKLVKFAKLL